MLLGIQLGSGAFFHLLWLPRCRRKKQIHCISMTLFVTEMGELKAAWWIFTPLSDTPRNLALNFNYALLLGILLPDKNAGFAGLKENDIKILKNLFC